MWREAAPCTLLPEDLRIRKHSGGRPWQKVLLHVVRQYSYGLLADWVGPHCRAVSLLEM